jgi:hypothetical protein
MGPDKWDTVKNRVSKEDAHVQFQRGSKAENAEGAIF